MASKNNNIKSLDDFVAVTKTKGENPIVTGYIHAKKLINLSEEDMMLLYDEIVAAARRAQAQYYKRIK